MNKFVAVALFALVAIVAVVSASGYGMQSGYGMPSGYGMSSGAYSGMPSSYGQNYERKTGFKTTIYHPYGGVSNRFDYRTFPAYGNSYASHPAPYIKTGLEYTIGDRGYGENQQY